MKASSKLQRRALLAAGLGGGGAALYGMWSPGVWEGVLPVSGGNAAWLEHGWLGAASWFERNRGGAGQLDRYRNDSAILALRDNLLAHGVRDAYPHLTPTNAAGELPPYELDVMATFVRLMKPVRVLPWVGGVLNRHMPVGTPGWTAAFIASLRAMLSATPELSGFHLNVEPWPDMNRPLLDLLRSLRDSMASDKRLSVATFPPEAALFRGVTWSREYYSEVTSIADQVAVMLYNSSLLLVKPYVWAVEQAAFNAMELSTGASVILGIPTFDSEGGYHLERVENIETACAGIRGAHRRYAQPHPRYQGVGVYAAWETDLAEWGRLKRQLAG